MSNDCSGGRLYSYLGLTNISPTLNVTISYEDFVKLCENPQIYFEAEMENLHRTRFFVDYPHSVGHDGDIAFNVKDIEILFVHDKEPEKVKERWDTLKEHINPDCFIYVLAERFGIIPQDILKRFVKLKGKKIILLRYPNFYGDVLKGCAVMNWQTIYNLDCPIENHFDLIGWLNDGGV